MKKAYSATKSIQKGKSTSSIQQYQQSRVTNKSIDTRKIDSKVYKFSKANSSVKIHQPLSIQNKASLKDSKSQVSKGQQYEVQNSRRKIQSHLEGKNSYNDNVVSFRQSQNKPNFSKGKQNQNIDQKAGTKIDLKMKQENQKLLRQNKELKQKLYRMQQTSLEDKDKIKTLITRISEIKRDAKCAQPSLVSGIMSKSKTTASYAHIMKTRGHTDRQNIQTSNYRNNQQQTPFRILQPSATQSKYSKTKQSGCGNAQCEEKRKYLEGQLYKQRIKRDQLQQEKKQWERNRDQLKRQYQDLLCEIKNLRQESGGQE